MSLITPIREAWPKGVPVGDMRALHAHYQAARRRNDTPSRRPPCEALAPLAAKANPVPSAALAALTSASWFEAAHRICDGMSGGEGELLRRDVKVALALICERFGVSSIDILSARRTQNVVLPRQVFMWLMRRYSPMSLPEISMRCGGRDHTTALHAARKVDALLAREGFERPVSWRAAIDLIAQLFAGGTAAPPQANSAVAA